MPATASATAPTATAANPSRKTATVPEKKYKCQFCNRAFSRSEHRSRHERSRMFSPTLVYFTVGLEGRWWGRDDDTSSHARSLVFPPPHSSSPLFFLLLSPLPSTSTVPVLLHRCSRPRLHTHTHTHTHALLVIPLTRARLVRRYQRATVPMFEMQEYICATRSVAATRSDRPCQRWRRSAPQRSQAPVRCPQDVAQDGCFQAIDRIGYGNVGTNRSKQ